MVFGDTDMLSDSPKYKHSKDDTYIYKYIYCLLLQCYITNINNGNPLVFTLSFVATPQLDNKEIRWDVIKCTIMILGIVTYTLFHK